MNPKYQIFISSTFIDLKDERDQITKAALEMGHIPVGMEMFSAGDDDQWQTIKRTIDACDYYAVIVAHRYGSLDDDGTGYTEKEYDYAVEKGLPIMGFVIDSSASWPNDRRDNDSDTPTRALKAEKLEKFKGKVKGRLVNYWKNGDDLQARFIASLSKIIVSHPRPGWVRATEAASPEIASELARLSKENAELRDKLAASEVVVFAPKIELTAWISWEPLMQHQDFGVKTTQIAQAQLNCLYRLHIQITNVGNRVCEAVSVSVKVPTRCIKNMNPQILKQMSRNGLFDMNFSLKSIQANKPTTHRGEPVLLPGKSEEETLEIEESAVETQTDWKLFYSIHPDQGYAIDGEIPFNQIEIRSHKPAPVPSPDSIQ